MKNGIILLSLGYELYGSCALNLAMSIKAYDSKVPILLIHDNKSIEHLTEAELALFDILKEADPADYQTPTGNQYQRMKLCVNKYTEFENTMYMDVDSIWFPDKQISKLFNAIKEQDFWIGKNGSFNPKTRLKTSRNYTFWEEPMKISRYFNLVNELPQTISGVFFFKRTEMTEGIFARALEVYDDKNAPCAEWAKGKPDEYCLNVALCQANYKQQDSHIVFFDKVNGNLGRKAMYDNFWGMAIGGNKVPEKVYSLYNELVTLFAEAFGFEPRLHRDKINVIPERRKY